MKTLTRPSSLPLVLSNGDRLTQKEFHRIYSRMPADFRAELIDGEVHVASPSLKPHGKNFFTLGGVLQCYENLTPGVETGDNSTVILDRKNEPQPDLYVLVAPDCGGRTSETPRGYIQGPPEFLIEVANSSRAIDLGRKKRSYHRAGVLEYLVFTVRDSGFHWFDLHADRRKSIPSDGVLKSDTFPGLWIDTAHVIARNVLGALETLKLGVQSPEHAAFVAKLAAAKALRQPSAG